MKQERDPRQWRELDVLRGMATVLMVINHGAVLNRSGPDAGLIDAAAFVGGFAPVLFYFLTGLGHGVQSIGRPPARGHRYLFKVAVLFAADALLWIGPGSRIGMDFLGFIGLSMLLLEWVRRAPRSGLIALLLGTAFVLSRFAVGPVVRPLLPGTGWGRWVGVFLGVESLAGFSYPPGPWMAYPFLGYLLGRLGTRHRPWLERHRGRSAWVLAVLAGLAAAPASVLVTRGAVLFRYGTMSWAYFLASLSVIGLSLAAVLGLSRARTIAFLLDGVALSGVRSFAVVPLHYVLLAVSVAVLGPVVGMASYLRNVLTVLALSLPGSAFVPRAAAALEPAARNRPGLAWALITSGVLAAYLVLATTALAGPAELAVRFIPQLLLSFLLVFPTPSPLMMGAGRVTSTRTSLGIDPCEVRHEDLAPSAPPSRGSDRLG